MILKEITIFDNKLELKDDKVFNKTTNKEIPVYLLDNGQRFIIVNNIKLNYGIFKLTCGYKCHLPVKYWEYCKVGFLDKDVNNYETNNLYIIFPEGGIEHEELKGYFYIPGYELNLANEQGFIYRTLKRVATMPRVSEKLAKENKWYVFAKIDINRYRSVSRRYHRLVALALLNPPENYPELVVDHLNSIKSDNRPENLEWVDHMENSDRAVDSGSHRGALEVVVKDKKTGEVKEYRSLKQMSQLTGFDHDTLSSARRSPNKTYKFRYIIKDKGDETPWEVYEVIKTVTRSGPVKARNVLTGEITHYEGYADAQRKTGVDRHAINDYFKFFTVPYILKGYEWKLEDDNRPWHEFNEYEMEKYRRGMHVRSKVYELVDVLKDERHVCYGWEEASVITGIGHRNILKAVQDKIVMKGRYKISILC